MHKLLLTPSQQASLVTGIVGLIVWGGSNIPQIEAIVTLPHWLKSALLLGSLVIPQFCRSLASSNSGVGKGPLPTGGDAKAAAATLAGANVTPTTPTPAPPMPGA